METLDEDPTYEISAVFKSYYVVWKLKDSEKYYERDNEFKSYYVVWKRIWQGLPGWFK